MKSALLALTLAATLGGAARADEAGDLISRYVAWRGGAAFEAAAGLHATGGLVGGDYSGVIERWQAPGHGREASTLGVMRNEQGFGPGEDWTVTLSGQVEGRSPAEAAAARRRALLTFDDALRGAGGAKVELLGDETLDGQAVKVLRVRFDGPDTYDLMLDPATGALVAQRLTEDKRVTMVRYGDWRRVHGVRMAFSEVWRSDIDPYDTKLTFRAIQVDPRLPAATWTKPAPRRIYAFKGGAKASQPLGFEFYLGSRIYIPATVQGVGTHVLLDSGAEVTVLDKAWAAKAGIHPGATVAASGTGGSDEAEMASGVDIVLGGLVLKNLTVGLMDLSPLEKVIGRPMPVILGKEVFNELVVDLDFDGRTIAFHEPAGFAPPPGVVATPATLSGGIRAVPVSVEGAAPILMDFDIGNGSPLIVFSDYAARTGMLADGRPVSKSMGGGIGGQKPRDIATVKAITFGGVTFHDVPTTFPAADGSAFDSTRTLGNIGLPVLSRFHLYTDYAHDQLWLKPVADATTRPFAKDRSGLATRMEGAAAKVLLVAPGSPAEAAGFKAGDLIAAVNGQSLATDGTSRLQVLKTLPAGTAVTVGLADGTSRSLTLKDYY